MVVAIDRGRQATDYVPVYLRIGGRLQNLLLILWSDLYNFGFLADYVHVVCVEIKCERSQLPLLTVILSLRPYQCSDADSISWTCKVDHIHLKTDVHISRQLTRGKILRSFLYTSLLSILENVLVFKKLEGATLLTHRTNGASRTTHYIPFLLLRNN